MLIVRFSDRRSLGQWVGSDERRSLTAEAASFSKEVYEEPSSLETWFAIPGMGAVEPVGCGNWIIAVELRVRRWVGPVL